MYRKQELARQGLRSKIRTALFSLVATTTLTLPGFAGTGTAVASTAVSTPAPMHWGTDCAPRGCHSPGAGWTFKGAYFWGWHCQSDGKQGQTWGWWSQYQCTAGGWRHYYELWVK